MLALPGAALAILLGIIALRTATYSAIDLPTGASASVGVPSGAAERLAGAIRFATISHEDPAHFDSAAFASLHRYLEAQFTRVHSQLRRETVARHSLLYTWQGSDPSLKPILLMGHMDVVPLEPGTERQWEEEPFDGRIRDGFIWGRGAIDNKSAVVGTLEAVEMLLAEGVRPARTVFLAYGHDEEVGGVAGARAIAAVLRQRDVQLEMVLDEGGVIGDGILPGVSVPTAMVGVAEKGFATVELTTRTRGGHSSLPPRETAIGILAAAVARVEAKPMDARLEGASRELFERIGPRFPLVQRAVFANLWLTRPLVISRLEGNPTTNAMVRTTSAPTIFQAGTKDNVLPSQARAVVNFRILPGDSIADVLEHVRDAVNDPRVEVRRAGAFSAEPSVVSSSQAESFRVLGRTVRSILPDAIVAPYLVVVVTDSRYFSDFTEDVYRLLPLRMSSEDLARIHGIDERVAVTDYERAILIYRQLILNLAAAPQ